MPIMLDIVSLFDHCPQVAPAAFAPSQPGERVTVFEPARRTVVAGVDNTSFSPRKNMGEEIAHAPNVAGNQITLDRKAQFLCRLENKVLGYRERKSFVFFSKVFIKEEYDTKTGGYHHSILSQVDSRTGLTMFSYAQISDLTLDNIQHMTFPGIHFANEFTNYPWHFYIDVLPKLRFLLPYMDEFRAMGAKLIVQAGFPAGYRRALEYFGIGDDMLAELAPGAYRFPVLFYPSCPVTDTHVGIPAPEDTAFLRHAFLCDTAPRYAPLVYLSRAGALTRTVRDEDTLVQAMTPLGFEFHQLNGMSLPDQANLFHNARVIVAPTGSGFANAVFCRPGTHYVELSPDIWEPVSWVLASAMDMGHSVVFPTHEIQRHLGPGYDPVVLATRYDPAEVMTAVEAAVRPARH